MEGRWSQGPDGSQEHQTQEETSTHSSPRVTPSSGASSWTSGSTLTRCLWGS